jgi:rsbT antagonist protein RsbS
MATNPESQSRTMASSTIQKLESLLLISVPGDLLDSDVLLLRRQVLQALRRHQSRWVLLDFSQVDICDSFFGRFIQSTAEMAGLMGAKVIVSGLQDAVVETMVELGMTLSNVHSVLDLDDALALSRESANGRGGEGENWRMSAAVGQVSSMPAPGSDLPLSDLSEV